MNKILFLFTFFFIHIYTNALANVCQGLFDNTKHQQIEVARSELINEKLAQLSGATFDKQQVTDILRLITGDPTSFPNIESVRVKKYWFSKRLRWTIKPPFLYLELKTPDYIPQFTFKMSKVKVPHYLPKEKKELLEFLFEYSISVEQYYRNINSLLSPIKINSIKENFLAYQISNKSKLLAVEMVISSPFSSPIEKLLFQSLKVWIQIEAATISIIKSHNPKNYMTELEKVLKKYHRDLNEVYALLSAEIPASQHLIPNQSLIKNKGLISRAWNNDVLQAVWSNWRILFPFTYFRPLQEHTFDPRNPIELTHRKWSLYSKFISDHFVTKTLLAYTIFLAIIPAEIYLNIQEIKTETQKTIEFIEKINLEEVQSDFQKNYEERKRRRENNSQNNTN